MFGRPGPGDAGGVNAPAETGCAEVIVTLGRLSLERLSHVDPPVGAAIKEPAEIISSVVIENFVTDILLSTISSCIVHRGRNSERRATTVREWFTPARTPAARSPAFHFQSRCNPNPRTACRPQSPRLDRPTNRPWPSRH